MTIDPASFEERRYTRQHDRVFHAVVQQVRELDARLRYIEGLVDPRHEDLPAETRAQVDEIRASSTALADRITTIGDSLDAVVAALDTSQHPAAAANGKAPAAAPPIPADDTIVVDLDTERRRKPSWRSGQARQPGWMPVTNP